MSVDTRQSHFQHLTAELLADERRLVEAVDQLGGSVQEPPEVAALLRRLRDQAAVHIDALTSYGARTAAATGTASAGAAAIPPVDGVGTNSAPPTSAVLRQVFVLVNALAIGYTALDAMAMRLFEPPLRELAPRHLRTHAGTAQAITEMLPRVVATELARAGLTCMCPCPMCTIGVCGCVSGATVHVTTAWRETAPLPDPASGYPLQPPRPGSQLAALGIPGGARVLSVDGEAVAATHPYDVQAAIRRHGAGEDIRLRILIDDAEPRDVVVSRADAESA
jgi:hypothetical protein